MGWTGHYTKAKFNGIARRFYRDTRMLARLYYICCHADVCYDCSQRETLKYVKSAILSVYCNSISVTFELLPSDIEIRTVRG
jgi:hypothetical protein